MTASGRDLLLTAAEDLFAERGIDAVSLREINAAAGSKNASGVQYHFGDRAGLVRAVLAKHRPAVEDRRHALLDEWDRLSPDTNTSTGADGATLRGLAEALVRPWAACLAEPGGPGYLQVLADLLNRPRPAIDPASLDDPTDSLYRWRALVAPLLSDDALVLHRRFVAIRFTATELARRSGAGRGAPPGRDDLFVSDLVDLVTGVLSAPVSAGTSARAQARKGRAQTER